MVFWATAGDDLQTITSVSKAHCHAQSGAGGLLHVQAIEYLDEFQIISRRSWIVSQIEHLADEIAPLTFECLFLPKLKIKFVYTI